jgi:scyllo-inositol 2-dehydrogenase (NADP+)
MQTISVALLGYGYAGKTFHAPLIANTSGLHLAAVCSSDSTKVNADWPEVFVSAEVDEVLKFPDITLVVIATPNDSHFELARRALMAGKNVVVDKPFTVTEDEARQLQILATRLGLLQSVFHNRRWDADFLTLKNLLLDGRLGKINYFESRIDRFRPQVRDRWRESEVAGGGLWYDLGPHLVDQALQLFGSPSDIESTFEIQRNNSKAVDFFRVRLIYPNLQVVLGASMLGADNGPRFVMQGSKACYVKYGMDPQEAALKYGSKPSTPNWGRDKSDGVLWINRAETLLQKIIPTSRGDYGHYYCAIRDSILMGKASPVSAEDGVEVMHWVEAAIHKSGTN